MKNYTFLLLIFILSTSVAFAQSPKKIYKAALELQEAGKYQDAIDSYTKALELEPSYVNAYVARAKCYESLNRIEEALTDYERASTFDPKEEEYTKSASELAYDLKQYERAIKNANLALERDKKLLNLYHVKIWSLFYLEKLDEAIETANKAIDIKKNFLSYYDKAEMLYAKKDYKEAQNNYQLAITYNRNNIYGYLGLANAYYYQDLYDQTISTANSALNVDQRSRDAYWIRALAYYKKIDYMNAIADLSQIIVLHPDDPNLKDVFYKRGEIYYDFNMHTNAINDFTSVIDIDKNYYLAYFKRAASYEAIHSYDKAIADYEQLDALNLKDAAALVMLEDAHKRLFELKRETDKPVLTISEPVITEDGYMQIVKGVDLQKIVGRIDDASPIKSFSINGTEVEFDSTSKKNEFAKDIIVKDKNEIRFAAVDVYDNVLTKTYPILRTEIGKPEIFLVQPIASDDGQIYMESEGTSLYIEGTVSDESKIASIIIDSVNASYIPSALNPSFAATISIVNKKKITMEVTDIFGNKTVAEYILNREGAQIAADNPMGKTWVVFIENSKYETFASLDGPTKDISMMKAALHKYSINNIITKRDMTKSQMERFFSIELRDMVIKNHVNSIIVWYAGHGKFLNNNGYWVPVDGKTDDEFTYFNINSLKAAMQSYSSVITHTLVITDACESGPSFYQAMRSDISERDCSDWKATKFKSSQVFSSAGYELASDNSQFTKTFANSLIHNPNSCIDIESIVLQVKKAVAKNKQQEPQFGKIDGLADENGTFFFIRK
jgi:tetratricopeptide (TPR) repeat protein